VYLLVKRKKAQYEPKELKRFIPNRVELLSARERGGEGEMRRGGEWKMGRVGEFLFLCSPFFLRPLAKVLLIKLWNGLSGPFHKKKCFLWDGPESPS
jgi:hypothetical protein